MMIFFFNATFITTQTHYLQYYYKLTTIEITYTTYDTIAYTTAYNAFNNPTGGGGLPYESDGDTSRKIRIKPLKETNPGVVQALFDPETRRC